MKILITENQKHLLRLVSRFSEFVEWQIEGYKKQKSKDGRFWCRYYDEDSFVDNVINRSVEELIDDQWHFFHDDTDKGGSTMDLDLLFDYGRKNYADQIVDVYRRKCGNSLNESKIDFIRRLPAVEEELNKHLKRVDPTKFVHFQDYLSYLAKVTLMYLGDIIITGSPRGENYDLYTEFRDHIIYGLRKDIKKIYDSGKPGSLFGKS